MNVSSSTCWLQLSRYLPNKLLRTCLESTPFILTQCQEAQKCSLYLMTNIPYICYFSLLLNSTAYRGCYSSSWLLKIIMSSIVYVITCTICWKWKEKKNAVFECLFSFESKRYSIFKYLPNPILCENKTHKPAFWFIFYLSN